MNNYSALMWGAIALTAACWGLATGLAIEKVAYDGINSWTLLLAMPVLTLAIGWLIHQAWDDLRNGMIIRSVVALALAIVSLSVTLPTSIGSAGSAKDTAVAEANAANRGIAFASGELAKAEADLKDAKAGVRTECEGAPAVIPDGTWPKCQWWRRQVEAHTLSVAKLGKEVSSAPAEKQPLSGETRIAWAFQKLGYAVHEEDVQMAQPMALPIALELLCAFFLFMALEFHTAATSATSMTTDVKAGVGTGETPTAGVSQPSALTEADWQELPSTDMFSGDLPEPPKPKRKSTKRQQRRTKVHNWVRDYTQEHGHPPPFRIVQGRFHLPAATASRWRQEGIKQALN